MPDGISLRCGKEERFVGGWPPPVRKPEVENCDKFIAFDAQRSRWEWDDTKSHRNVDKHGISFQDAVSALEADNKSIRLVSKSWESLDSLDYEELGIQRTQANADPVRDTYLFKRDENVWVLVSTLRGEFGLITQRVISVRRARDNERSIYEQGLGQ
ncbi:BrnT family toxin [Halomonas sp. BC04]|uniref:BrnT family toxin n=1 Tax=Halomonas sp. BC04 TaxID=1403540 RepID=UPI0018CC638C|nr:BrnT family toxin [Halomonas sp. BC04]